MAETLILIEHDRQQVKRPSLHAITLARQLGREYALLLLGHGLDEIAASLVSYGASAVIAADDPALEEPLADRYAMVIAEAVQKYGAKTLLGTSSTFSKDVLPRAAALLDAPMVTDVLAIEETDGSIAYRRPLNAGSMLATVKVEGDRRVLTARATAFEAPASDAAPCPIERFAFDVPSLPAGMEFISREQRKSDRPDLTEARVVVCGGRPLKDKDTFERLIGGLADTLGGAVGATRAAVDAGMAPNDYQVGQTGKIVAPELYIGLGISGAIQHLAGIKDSRVIVAINKDPEASIFQMATYGLVGDLHQIVPQLIESIRRGQDG
jgi:electron transfer flavoprotein alpha subunit